MRHKSNNKTRPLFTLSLEMTRLVNETRLLLVPTSKTHSGFLVGCPRMCKVNFDPCTAEAPDRAVNFQALHTVWQAR